MQGLAKLPAYDANAWRAIDPPHPYLVHRSGRNEIVVDCRPRGAACYTAIDIAHARLIAQLPALLATLARTQADLGADADPLAVALLERVQADAATCGLLVAARDDACAKAS